jgi:hypothetical protein
MPLSSTQYLKLRDLTGGRTKTSSKDHLTDAELQAEFDDAASDWNTAIVYVLRRRLGMASGYVNKTLDLNSTSMAQYRDHLQKLLDAAEKRAGLSGGTLSGGTLDLNLDTDYDDLDTA